MTGEPRFFASALLKDIPSGTTRLVDVLSHSILLCNEDGRIYAVSPHCSHADEPLACGRIKNGWIACPAHGARFDLETGEAMNPPATAPIATFAVRVRGGVIEVAV
jgi:3-phenylpropionate/trans-cinnamate dioxygenase ferredoxin component